MRQGKSFGNRLDFWKVRPWGKHQSEHQRPSLEIVPSGGSIQFFANTQAFEDSMNAVILSTVSLDTP